MASPSDSFSPLSLWHLLSLDAPTVAALWTWFVARTMHITLPHAIPVAMFLAVWLLYAADRLLDACQKTNCRHPERSEGPPHFTFTDSTDHASLEPRHLFHHYHRRAFTLAILIVAPILLILILAFPPLISRLYLALAALLFLWFATIHLFANRKPLPKELIPGPFFAAAVFIPAIAASSLALCFAALCFAFLCVLNCLYIYAWEHSQQTSATTHPTTRLALRFLTPLTILAAVLPLTLIPAEPELAPVLSAISLAAVMLLALNNLRSHLDRTHLRAAADFVLLTPLLIVPLLR